MTDKHSEFDFDVFLKQSRRRAVQVFIETVDAEMRRTGHDQENLSDLGTPLEAKLWAGHARLLTMAGLMFFRAYRDASTFQNEVSELLQNVETYHQEFRVIMNRTVALEDFH